MADQSNLVYPVFPKFRNEADANQKPLPHASRLYSLLRIFGTAGILRRRPGHSKQWRTGFVAATLFVTTTLSTNTENMVTLQDVIRYYEDTEQGLNEQDYDMLCLKVRIHPL